MTSSSKTSSIARIVISTPTGVEKHLGMAIVVDDRHVMTCCHVLNDALGRTNRLDPERPTAELKFAVLFPYANNAQGVGRVEEWGLDYTRPKDVAVLWMERAAPTGAAVAEFSEADVEGEKWSCTGYDGVGHERAVAGVLGPVLARDEIQLNGQDGRAPLITSGYSGAGVWAGNGTQTLVGMVVTRDEEQGITGLAYAIPTCVLAEVWPGLKRSGEGESSSQRVPIPAKLPSPTPSRQSSLVGLGILMALLLNLLVLVQIASGYFRAQQGGPLSHRKFDSHGDDARITQRPPPQFAILSDITSLPSSMFKGENDPAKPRQWEKDLVFGMHHQLCDPLIVYLVTTPFPDPPYGPFTLHVNVNTTKTVLPLAFLARLERNQTVLMPLAQADHRQGPRLEYRYAVPDISRKDDRLVVMLGMERSTYDQIAQATKFVLSPQPLSQ